MKLILRIPGLLLILMFASGARASAEQYLELATHMVKIHVTTPEGQAGSGTGVQLDANHVVTNCHVVASAKRVVVARGSSGVEAQVRSADTRHDLCVLSIAAPMAHPVEVSPSRTLKPGDVVHAMGFSGGKVLSMSAGRVTALHQMDNAAVIETDAEFQQGASGGALFNSEGRLVGVLTFFIPGMKRHFAVPSEWVMAGLSSVRDLELPLAGSPPPFWAAAGAEKPFFLRAIQYENDEDWGRLKAVVQQWEKADPGSAAAINASMRASRLSAR
jgi:serine protease Do